jgi:hypothetical protein
METRSPSGLGSFLFTNVSFGRKKTKKRFTFHGMLITFDVVLWNEWLAIVLAINRWFKHKIGPKFFENHFNSKSNVRPTSRSIGTIAKTSENPSLWVGIVPIFSYSLD